MTHLQAAEVARRWGVSKTYVSMLIRRGDLAARRFGRALRVPLSEVERYERAAEVKPERVLETELIG